MRLLHKPVPLNAPKQDGEIVYTTLQLSRLRRTAINFQRVSIASIVFFNLAVVLVFAVVITDARNRVHDQCVSGNRGRAEIKQAFGDLYDGFIAASGPNAELARKFKADRMAALNKGLPQRQC